MSSRDSQSIQVTKIMIIINIYVRFNSLFIFEDEAVSLGAAVLAGILDGDIKDMQVLITVKVYIFMQRNNDSYYNH